MNNTIKIVFLFFFFTLCQSYAQWGFTADTKGRKISAIGEVTFNVHKQDTIVLHLSKSRKLGLDFAIEGEYFQRAEKYYVLFEIDERKIKVLSALPEKGKLRIVKLKDLISKEEYEMKDFLNILKRGSECVLTINTGVKVMQGVNTLAGSEKAINSVLRGNNP